MINEYGNGNVEAVLDGAQQVAAYRYDPFGVLLAQTGSLTQPYGFSTKRYDPDIGMIQHEYRNYFPAIGSWGTRDPLGEAGGMNLYGFVGNNPINGVDPWGLTWSNWFLNHYTPEGEIRSPLLLRLIVPGQIAWDRARNDFRRGDVVGAVLNTANMVGEQMLVVSMVGQGAAMLAQGASTIPGAVNTVCAGSSSTIPIIKGTRGGGVDPAHVQAIMADMLSGDYRYTSMEGIIGGFVDSSGVYYVVEGHHRMAAALRVYNETGNAGVVLQLIENGLWTLTNNPPKAYPFH